MTDPVVSSYPGYATPTFTHRSGLRDWLVRIAPGAQAVGIVKDSGAAGWTAWDPAVRYVGLFPDMEAAGEALVKHAGYEVLR